MRARRLLAASVLLASSSIASSFAPPLPVYPFVVLSASSVRLHVQEAEMKSMHSVPSRLKKALKLRFPTVQMQGYRIIVCEGGMRPQLRRNEPGLIVPLLARRNRCFRRCPDLLARRDSTSDNQRSSVDVDDQAYGVTLETDPAILAEGRRIVGLCCMVGVISSLDRQAMSVAIVPMSKAMGYSDTVKGSISSIFSLGYTLALLPLGAAQQVVSARLLMAGGVIAWSSFTLLTPTFADIGVTQLLAVRMMVGAAEAVTVPTVQTFVARWIPPARRSSALALLSTAFQLGTITALLTAPRIVESSGWEGVFYSFGTLGFVWVAAWLGVAKDSPPLPQAGGSEAAGPGLSTGGDVAVGVAGAAAGLMAGGASVGGEEKMVTEGGEGVVTTLSDLPWRQVAD